VELMKSYNIVVYLNLKKHQVANEIMRKNKNKNKILGLTNKFNIFQKIAKQRPFFS
jgi:hypothetical protein